MFSQDHLFEWINMLTGDRTFAIPRAFAIPRPNPEQVKYFTELREKHVAYDPAAKIGACDFMLSKNLKETLQRALNYANEYKHEYSTSEHLLLSLTEDEDACTLMQSCAVDIEQLRHDLVVSLSTHTIFAAVDIADDADYHARPSSSLQIVLARAAIRAAINNASEITGAHVLAQMLSPAHENCYVANLLQKHGIGITPRRFAGL